MPTEAPTFDIIAREFCDLLHHLEHAWDGLLQHFHLFADNFIYDLVCEMQNPLQPVENVRRHLVAFILFLQELNGQELPLTLIGQ